MKLTNLNQVLSTSGDSPLFIMLPSGEMIPEHFHVTEIGRVHKSFIDCGGTRRESVTCLLQTWTARDFEHRITTSKLSKILKLAESVVGSEDIEVEVEYGADIASQYKLTDIFVKDHGVIFVLDGKQTDCLARDKCGVTPCSPGACC